MLLFGVCSSVPAAGPDVRARVIRRIAFDDIRSVDDLGAFGIVTGRNRARVVPAGPGGAADRCLEVETPEPAVFCALSLVKAPPIERNLVLAFDHREEIEPGYEGAYLGIGFYGPDGTQAAWTSDVFSPKWRHVEIVLPLLPLRGKFAGQMRKGFRFKRIQIYARSRDREKRGDRPCRMKLYVDNLEFAVRRRVEMRSGAKRPRPYICHNPPLFDWPGTTQPGFVLQYSRFPEFPSGRTREVRVPHAYPLYVPSQPLEPGRWWFRCELRTDLAVGWGPVQEVEIPKQTHSYRLKPLNPGELRRFPPPRFLRLLRMLRNVPDSAEGERLVQRAMREARKGVPPHPGPYRKGDPRWPQWIDWYGKVADRITAGTGRRLRRVAEAALLTNDPRAVEAAKHLLLEACKWDPEGGSAERYGDLQAAALLDGMLWCWDASRGRLSDGERKTVLAVLRARVDQFFRRVSPFRINPAQNHSWRRNEAVMEAGVALLGDIPQAETWLAVSVHNLVYRILPSMGFDGEDAEGIAYWNYGVNMLARSADLLRFTLGIDVYDHPWLRRTCRFPLYCAPPGAYAISFADNSHRGNASIVGPFGRTLTGRLGKRVKDPYSLWYAAVPDPPVAPRPPADFPQSIAWPYIGYALFHTCLSEGLEDVAVGMRCGPYYAGHQHADNNDFVIHAWGDKLAVDGGYYDWYGSPHHKTYSTRTRAHNTLLVDGQGQARDASGRFVAFFDSPNFGYAVGDASSPDIYGGRLKRFERRLLFLKPRFVVVHDLVVTDGKKRRIDWLLHAHTTGPFPADSATREFDVVRTKARLRGWFLLPERMRLTVRKSFEVLPQKPRESVPLPASAVQPEWTLYAAPAAPVRQADICAVLAVLRPDERAGKPVARQEATPEALAFVLRAPWGTYTVLLRRCGGGERGLIRGLGMETDGDAAVVLTGSDGTVLDAFRAGGSLLRFRGRTIDVRASRFVGDSRTSGGARVRWSETVRRLRAPLLDRGARRALQGREYRYASGPRRVWWAVLKTDAPWERCMLSIRGWNGKRPPTVRLGAHVFTGVRERILLPHGTSCLSITGEGSPDEVRIDRLTFRPVEAERIPRNAISIGADDIVIDADAPGPARQSPERSARVMKKVGSHGGTALCVFDGPVQWAEWTFEVPRAGAYELLVRGASAHDVIDREVRIDGRPFPSAGVAVRMRGTGGWCRTTDDWAWDRVCGPGGRLAVVHLDKGPHTLHWEYLAGSQNLDVLVLQRAPDKVRAGGEGE